MNIKEELKLYKKDTIPFWILTERAENYCRCANEFITKPVDNTIKPIKRVADKTYRIKCSVCGKLTYSNEKFYGLCNECNDITD